MAIEVTAPGGATWRVRRSWLELRRPRWRGADSPGLDLPSIDGGGDELGIFAIIGLVLLVVVVAILVVTVGIPLLVFGAELIVVLVLAVAGLLGRVVLRRPWLIVATAAGDDRVERRVAGWRDSRDAMRELAGELRDGRVAADAPRAPGDAVAEAEAETSDLRAWVALVLGLLWLGGVGSLVALWLAVLVLRRRPRSQTSTIVGWVAAVLAVAGIVLGALLVIGLLADPGTLA